MSFELFIRSATDRDEARVVSLWQICNLTTSYNDPIQDFRFAKAKANSDVLVGTNAKGLIIGSVMVGHDGHRGWVYYVATDPGYRKRGIGRKMIEAAEQWLSNHGIVKIMLLVRETNTQVVDFYKRLGFESAPRVVMQKWLPTAKPSES